LDHLVCFSKETSPGAESDDEPLYARVPDHHSRSSSPDLTRKQEVEMEHTPYHIKIGHKVFPTRLDSNMNQSPTFLERPDIDLKEFDERLERNLQEMEDMTPKTNGHHDFDELSVSDLRLEDLTESQQDLKKLHDKMKAERHREQQVALQEQQRLEEILNMCAEYEKQLEGEEMSRQRASSPSVRNSLTKIKTNGSLGKLASPTLMHKEPAFDYKWQRHSGSSNSEEEGTENGTIKRRPKNTHTDIQDGRASLRKNHKPSPLELIVQTTSPITPSPRSTDSESRSLTSPFSDQSYKSPISTGSLPRSAPRTLQVGIII
jgi:hypothetical protein